MVPATVDTAVAITAHAKVTPTASRIGRLENIRSYQRSENPVKFVSDLERLKLKKITYRIGR